MDTKIVLGVPSLDTIKTETVVSIFSATAVLEYPATLHIQKSCYIHDARNKIVNGVIK